MPHFNESSALLFKRFVETGVASPEELANVMGNASVETGAFSTRQINRSGLAPVPPCRNFSEITISSPMALSGISRKRLYRNRSSR